MPLIGSSLIMSVEDPTFAPQPSGFPAAGRAVSDLNLSALKGEDSQATLGITTLTLAPEGSHRPYASGF